MLVLLPPYGWLLAGEWSARNPGRMVLGALRLSLRGDGFCKRSGSLPVSRQFRQLKRLDDVGIDFNADGLLEEMYAQNQPGDVFLSPFEAILDRRCCSAETSFSLRPALAAKPVN
jgi:hypothetical protein